RSGLSSGLEAVAQAEFGEQVAGAGRVGFEFAAQLGEVLAGGGGRGWGGGGPAAGEGGALGGGRGRGGGGGRGDGGTGGGGGGAALKGLDGLVGQVDEVVPDPDRGGGLGAGGAAGHRADPGQQLVDGERLGDVVVGARVEGVHLVLAPGPAGQHDDRHLGPAAQPVDDLDAVDVRQAEVEDDQVGRAVLGLPQRAGPVGGHRHLEPAGRQVDPQRPHDLRLRVDDPRPGHPA